MIMLIKIFLFSLSTHAIEPVFTNCKDELVNVLNTWGINKDWAYKENKLFITSTQDFGKWVWFKDEVDSFTLTRATQFEQVRVNFKKSNCEKKMMVVPVENSSTALNNDEFLKQTVSGKSGLIYIWSPQMPLSYKGIPSILAAAKKKNLEVNIFVDNKAKLSKSHHYNPKYLNRIDSFELKMRNAYVHFPSLLAYKNGVMVDKIKYGFETAIGYEKDVKDVFNF